EELGKANVEAKVESMVTVLIHQASSSVPPLSTLVTDLTPLKQVSPPVQEPVFTTTTTTLLLPPPPPQQQSNTDPVLAACVSTLEQRCANLAKKNKKQDQTSQALSSRIFTLENHDLYSKIDKYINENVKDAIQDALKDPVCERFGELSEFEMKEILHDRMFESGSYRSNPEHAALYDTLVVSMDRKNREEFIEATTMPSPSNSFKQKIAPQSEQPVYDVPIPDDMHILDSEDTGAAHLPKIKTRPDWVIPPNDLPETENNWANALTKPIMIQRKTSYFRKLEI
ncbi:hypothetical protein Tco_1033582, partial [Tanacetum coccineum]